jgi:hypothetical protein
MKNSKSYNKKDDCKCDHFKKKSDKAMHNDQSSLSSAGSSSGKGVDLDLLRALALVLALTQAAEAMKTIMLSNMIASQAQRPNVGVCILRTMMTDITIAWTRGIAFLQPSMLQRQREVIAPKNRELRQQNLMT